MLFLRSPENQAVWNSQTIQLLEGYLNVNPTGTGGPSLAMVDNTVLSATSEETGPFVDPGKSGSGQISVYIVREGDTISSLAEMFGVSTNTIRWANSLKSNILKPGQELVILPISGVRHSVVKGDTLQSLAKKYKADLEDILSYNNLATDAKIAVGDVVIIPDGVISAAPRAVAVSSGGSGQSVVSGYFLRPIRGGVRSQGIHGYNGVDIAAPVGTSIMAAADGTVILARGSGYNGGYGLYVVVKHANGTQTLYAHMSRVSVSVGQSVKQGQTIGAVGNTGRSTGPHIHFEVRGARNPF